MYRMCPVLLTLVTTAPGQGPNTHDECYGHGISGSEK